MKGLAVSLVCLLALSGIVFLRSGQPVSRSPETRLFVVSKGQGAREIADALAEAKLIRSKNFFLFLIWRRGDKNAFRAGSFELSPSMTGGEIERALAEGKPVSDEREITIPEGWTLDDIADYLETQGLASKKDFYAEAGESARFVRTGALPDWNASYPALADKPVSASLEGYLFPDTYRVYVGGGAGALVRRMLDNLEVRLTPELRAEMKAGGHSVHELLTMASIIEREVRGERDRAMVSDIFWRRISAGIGLGADSTVNYLTGHSKPSVSYLDTKIDNPWNTYKYRSLPPGPIGNPGLSAIRAALHPESNPYWYFLTDKEGKVHYAKTLQEQSANKAKYLH